MEKLPLNHAGVDEAGRGPLAGPVVAAAVIAGMDIDLEGIRDSKKLSEKQRNHWYEVITEQAQSWSVVALAPADIDRLNILQATMLAMQRAVQQLDTKPKLVLIDGNKAPELSVPVKTVIGGDDIYPAISAASVLAKVYRDKLMRELDSAFPQYGFAKHKGYPTPQHLAALKEHGPCPHHRRSFSPVKQLSLL